MEVEWEWEEMQVDGEEIEMRIGIGIGGGNWTRKTHDRSGDRYLTHRIPGSARQSTRCPRGWWLCQGDSEEKLACEVLDESRSVGRLMVAWQREVGIRGSFKG